MSLLYVLFLMGLVGFAIYTRKHQLDTIKMYLFFFFHAVICTSFWSIYIDEPWLFLEWTGSRLSIAILNLLVALYKPIK